MKHVTKHCTKRENYWIETGGATFTTRLTASRQCGEELGHQGSHQRGAGPREI